MNDRAAQPDASGRPPSASAAPPIETSSRFRYAAIVVGSAVAALLIAALLAWLRPLAPPDESALDGPSDLPPQAISAERTIALPSTPAEATAQQLRDELLELSDDLLARFPETPEALHVVALLFADLQKTTEAEKLWLKCIQLAPKRTGPYIGLATASMELGKDDEAVETLRRAVAHGCSSSDIYHQLAEALTKLGSLEEAEAVMQEGLAAFPNAPENWLQLGQVQMQLGRLAEAEKSLRTAIQQGTTSGTAYFSLATVCARQGKTDEAAKYREQFSQQKKAAEPAAGERFQVRYDAEMRQIAVASLCRSATVYDHQKLPELAEPRFLRALALEPAQAVVCNELAMFYRHLGRIADARLVQARLVEIEPKNVLHRANLASLALQLGDTAAAEATLKQIVGLRPDISLGYAGLAHLYLQTGRFDQARWFAEAALRQTPVDQDETVRTYVLLAAACRETGDAQGAQSALARARKLAPEDPRLQQVRLEP